MNLRLARQDPDHEVQGADHHPGRQVADDHGSLNHSSELGGGHVSGFGDFGHFGFGSVVSSNSIGQVQRDPELHYLDDGALVSQFERFVVFNARNPREQIGVLALDEEHAEVEGANHLGISRFRCAVIRTPGFLDSLSLA